MKNRTRRLKQSLVRVWVGGRPCGSGFVAGAPGQILTCFHVVQNIAPNAADPQQVQISIAAAIEAEAPDGSRFPAVPHPNCPNQNFGSAIASDFMLLSAPELNAPALTVGSYDSIEEGEDIYLGGFPLAIEQPVVARGLFSTKWRTPAYLIQAPERNVSWLDITMNRGNSGGPILRMAEQETDDAVIGIASFGLNPFADDMERIIQIAESFPGGAAIMGVPMKPFFATVGHALSANSLGVSGCVSIEYAKCTLP